MPSKTRLVLILASCWSTALPSAHSAEPAFAIRVVKDASTGDYRKLRRMITGPEVNEHPTYPGCTGFVGWESVTRLRNGDLLCSFPAGSWQDRKRTRLNSSPW